MTFVWPSPENTSARVIVGTAFAISRQWPGRHVSATKPSSDVSERLKRGWPTPLEGSFSMWPDSLATNLTTPSRYLLIAIWYFWGENSKICKKSGRNWGIYGSEQKFNWGFFWVIFHCQKLTIYPSPGPAPVAQRRRWQRRSGAISFMHHTSTTSTASLRMNELVLLH